MPGLTFDDAPPPDPHTPLVTWLDEWVERTAQKSSRTAAGYVSDAAMFAEILLDVVGKPRPQVLDDPAMEKAQAEADDVRRVCGMFGCRPGSYVRARAVFTTLILLDLHPRNIGRCVSRFQATRRYRSISGGDQAGGRSAATTRRAAAAWSSYCQFLVDQQVLATNPVAAPSVTVPKQPNYRPAPLSYIEVERLFATAIEPDPRPRARSFWPVRDLAIVATFTATGIRCGEATAAREKDLFDEPGVAIRLQVLGKGNKHRTIPIHDEAAEALRDYRAERARRLGAPNPESPLFVRPDGRPLDSTAMYRIIDRLFTRAGVVRKPGATVHALRHTFATMMVDDGANIVELQTLMGHESMETTKRYLDATAAGLQDAVNSHTSRRLLREARERRERLQPQRT